MKLYLGGYFSYYLPSFSRQLEVQLTEPTRFLAILESKGIPLAEVYLVVVNDELVDLETAIVFQNDEVKIYPAINGG